MRKQNKLTVSLIPTLLLVLCVVPAVAGQGRFRGRPEFLLYTRNLPAVDRIELLQLKPREGQLGGGGIVATKILTGAEAKKVASLWRKQTYTSSDSACHEPAYAIKFYSAGKLLAYASICWSCNNIYFITPHLERQQTFAGGNKRGEELSEVFRLAFTAAN